MTGLVRVIDLVPVLEKKLAYVSGIHSIRVINCVNRFKNFYNNIMLLCVL